MSNEDVRPLPPGFKDPRDRLALNEVPLIDVSELPRAPVTELTEAEYRKAVIAVDETLVAPQLDRIAKGIGVDVIDNDFYKDVMPVTDKSSSICVIRNRDQDDIRYVQDKGFAEWEGIQIVVSGFVVAAVRVRAYAQTNEGAFMYVRVFDKRKQEYVYQGDPKEKRALKEDIVYQLVMNYLEQEGIINSILIL